MTVMVFSGQAWALLAVAAALTGSAAAGMAVGAWLTAVAARPLPSGLVLADELRVRAARRLRDASAALAVAVLLAAAALITGVVS
ncbi:hypothetical protein ACIBF1_44215 [Spirillospora sp. NPDC050679]